jgi:two-component system, sensor histidine kinase and response regulator
LLAEDNPMNRQIVVELLQTRGHSVKLAANGHEVLQALDRDSFDVILMDVQMPEMDGFETTAVIRNRESESGGHIPIIALTGMATESDRKRCLEAGMDAYLGKPVRARELFDTVERGLKK